MNVCTEYRHANIAVRLRWLGYVISMSTGFARGLLDAQTYSFGTSIVALEQFDSCCISWQRFLTDESSV